MPTAVKARHTAITRLLLDVRCPIEPAFIQTPLTRKSKPELAQSKAKLTQLTQRGGTPVTGQEGEKTRRKLAAAHADHDLTDDNGFHDHHANAGAGDGTARVIGGTSVAPSVMERERGKIRSTGEAEKRKRREERKRRKTKEKIVKRQMQMFDSSLVYFPALAHVSALIHARTKPAQSPVLLHSPSPSPPARHAQVASGEDRAQGTDVEVRVRGGDMGASVTTKGTAARKKAASPTPTGNTGEGSVRAWGAGIISEIRKAKKAKFRRALEAWSFESPPLPPSLTPSQPKHPPSYPRHHRHLRRYSAH